MLGAYPRTSFEVDFGTPWDKDAIAEMSKQRLQSTSTIRANGSPGSNSTQSTNASTSTKSDILMNITPINQPREDLDNDMFESRKNLPFSSLLTPIKVRPDNPIGGAVECTGVKVKHPITETCDKSLNKTLYTPKQVCSKKHKKTSCDKRKSCKKDDHGFDNPSFVDTELPRLTRNCSTSEISPRMAHRSLRRFSLSHIEDETSTSHKKKISASESLRRQALLKMPCPATVIQQSLSNRSPARKGHLESLTTKHDDGSINEITSGDKASIGSLNELICDDKTSIGSTNELRSGDEANTGSLNKLIRCEKISIGSINKLRSGDVDSTGSLNELIRGDGLSIGSFNELRVGDVASIGSLNDLIPGDKISIGSINELKRDAVARKGSINELKGRDIASIESLNEVIRSDGASVGSINKLQRRDFASIGSINKLQRGDFASRGSINELKRSDLSGLGSSSTFYQGDDMTSKEATELDPRFKRFKYPSVLSDVFGNELPNTHSNTTVEPDTEGMSSKESNETDTSRIGDKRLRFASISGSSLPQEDETRISRNRSVSISTVISCLNSPKKILKNDSSKVAIKSYDELDFYQKI